MSWQRDVEDEAERLGLRKTSGYRTPAQERALGGPVSSFHSRGTPEAPGAIDIGGSASKLKQLFEEIRLAFAGRIAELYLNLPGGTSEDIKNNQALSRNPEAGRPQHLHVALTPTAGPALTPTTAPTGALQPASAIPSANRGEKAVEAAGGECARSISWTTPAGWVSAALGKEPPEGAAHSICWSDVWVYGAAMGLVLGGFWLTFRGKGNGS